MVEINLEKKHLYLFISILLFFIGAGFVFAANTPTVSHTIAEVEGLSDYFLTKGLLNPKEIVCPTGQCLKELDVRGNPRCEKYDASATLTNEWVDVFSTFTDCSTTCKQAGFHNSGNTPEGYTCLGTLSAGWYTSGGSCMYINGHNQGPVLSCYCVQYEGTFTCPTPAPSTPVHINKVTEPVSCSGYPGCFVACPVGWFLEGCDHLYQTFSSYGVSSGSSTTNHLNCNCAKYF